MKTLVLVLVGLMLVGSWAMAREPNQADLRNALVAANWEQAIDIAEALIAGGDESTTVLHGYATALVDVGRADEAEPILLQLIEARPSDIHLPFLLAKCYRAQGRLEESSEVLENHLISNASHRLIIHGVENRFLFLPGALRNIRSEPVRVIQNRTRGCFLPC